MPPPAPPPSQRLLLVGGHSRNIGKTALVCDILRAFPHAAWTAVKITQYGHGLCSINGDSCNCAPAEHSFALDEEHSRDNRTDTSRFLLAGARRSFWLRAKQGQLASALPLLRDAISAAENVIIESNSLLQFLRPSLYLLLLDPSVSDFKDSARIHFDRADLLILRSPLPSGPGESPISPWPGVSPSLLSAKPLFPQPLGAPLPPSVLARIRSLLSAPHLPSGNSGGYLSC